MPEHICFGAASTPTSLQLLLRELFLFSFSLGPADTILRMVNISNRLERQQNAP